MWRKNESIHMDHNANRPIKSLIRMNEIIEALAELNGAGLKELANHLGESESLIHAYVSTLRQLEFIVKEDSEYKLSLRFLTFGGQIQNENRLYQVAKPELKELAREVNTELVTLIVEERGLAVCLEVRQGAHDVKYYSHVGTQIHLHYSAAGKAILANLPEKRVEDIIQARGLPVRTEQTITDQEELFEELEQIRDEGISYELEEYQKGLIAIGAPILNAEGEVLGGLSVSGPIQKLDGELIEEVLPEQVLSSVNIIELNYEASRM